MAEATAFRGLALLDPLPVELMGAFVIDHVSGANLCDQDAIIKPDVFKRSKTDAVTAGNLWSKGLPLSNPSQGGAVCRFSPSCLHCFQTSDLIAKVTSSAHVNPKG